MLMLMSTTARPEKSRSSPSHPDDRFRIATPAALLIECQRVLPPGGRIVVVGVSRTCEQGPDCELTDLRRMLTAAGFAIKEAEVRRMWAPIEIVLAVKGIGPST